MTEDQELADLGEQFPGWHLWRGRDGHGQPRGWHATGQTAAGSTIVAADGPAQLRARIRQLEAKATAR